MKGAWKSGRVEALIVGILAAAFLMAVGVDLRSYFVGDTRSRMADQSLSQVSLLRAPGGPRVGQAEVMTSGTAIVNLDGFGKIEQVESRTFRHGLGPESVITIRSIHSRAHLRLAFWNSFASQELRVSFNGQSLETITSAPEKTIEHEYDLALRRDLPNEVRIQYARFRDPGVDPLDRRLTAGKFFTLELDFSQ